MSQKKVDAYKDYKKNKKEILKKEKRVAKIEKGVVAAIIVVFIAWFGVSAYQMATRPLRMSAIRRRLLFFIARLYSRLKSRVLRDEE